MGNNLNRNAWFVSSKEDDDDDDQIATNWLKFFSQLQ